MVLELLIVLDRSITRAVMKTSIDICLQSLGSDVQCVISHQPLMGCLTSPFSLLISFITLCFFFSFSFSLSLTFFFSPLSSRSLSFALSLVKCSEEVDGGRAMVQVSTVKKKEEKSIKVQMFSLTSFRFTSPTLLVNPGQEFNPLPLL